MLGTEVLITGAGRTDAGVHAREMIAHFDRAQPFDATGLVHRLNRFLPRDIAIQWIRPVREEAHARFTARSRTYEYWVHTAPDPFLEDGSFYVYGRPDFDRMNLAASLLPKHNDFECFSKSNTDVRTYLCAISRAHWAPAGEHHWVFTIEADRFLRNMVRAVVGTLLEIGLGKKEIGWMEEVLRSGRRSQAGASVPAKGLYLTNIQYPKEIWL